MNVNGRPTLRVGDSGIHAACCGPNNWVAVKGAPSVFINGKPSHRLGDADQHCGGMGKLVEGSPDVFIGDFAGAGRNVTSKRFDHRFQLTDSLTGVLLTRQPYRITGPTGVIEGITDDDGMTQVVDTGSTSARVTLEIIIEGWPS